jgi:hypothetical protein
MKKRRKILFSERSQQWDGKRMHFLAVLIAMGDQTMTVLISLMTLPKVSLLHLDKLLERASSVHQRSCTHIINCIPDQLELIVYC